ncbi:MarR family transcriptional regulator [Gordonia araii NBRC 100433]|uniref:MarR family transcriptional regulator n=1 Tax=Gordonia araii NBRC 100433 TaxID=1073574 RepID=G7H1T2_9ACTN|nr:MarR family winged helix-turn-helix transcriptional regulator [Gordonia araii]NNG97142.1 winged helix-turn-helix transcriptional regulator [Gordonia araii NBRC 100433]GAB09807.1 MarR family transcriptional regulator [Gordonia araii NBRC 100433]
MTALRDFDDEQQAADERAALTPAQRCAWESVVHGGWKLLATVNQRLADAGFSSTPDLRVLEALGREPRMRISDIAAATHIQMSTVSRQVSRLIDAGLVERVEEVKGDDARHRWVRPSAAGLEHLRELIACRDALVVEHVVNVLGEDDFLELGRLFGKLTVEGETCPEEGGS